MQATCPLYSFQPPSSYLLIFSCHPPHPHRLPSLLPPSPLPHSLVPLNIETMEVVGTLWPRALSSLQPGHDLCLHLAGQVGRKD